MEGGCGHNGACNQNGPCWDGEVWESESDNHSDDIIRNYVSKLPLVGFLAGMIVPQTKQMNAMRFCPGAQIDQTSSYAQEYALLGVIVALIFIYVMMK